MHPTDAIVESLVNEELTPGDGSVCIQPFGARHLKFGTKEEGSMWIDQQEGMVRVGVGRCNGNPVRSPRLRGGLVLVRLLRCSLRATADIVLAIERGELRDVHSLDIATDAALGK